MDISKKACRQLEVVVSKESLPLSCPNRYVDLWDAHPKVFIPIEDSKPNSNGVKEELCPYCSTKYILK